MIRNCDIAIYYRLLIYSDLIIGSNVLGENGLCICNDLFSVSSDMTNIF